ncbi:MAG TPA: hypothetical protein VKB42_01425 [Dongiaceae bacterium]|nr:hypothetical protein [Dongiaceae bacterium]
MARGRPTRLEVALDLAEQHQAEIRLLHVLLRDKEPTELLRLPDLDHAKSNLAGELQQLAQAPAAARSASEIMSNPGFPDRPVPVGVLRKIGTYLLRRCRKLGGGAMRSGRGSEARGRPGGGDHNDDGGRRAGNDHRDGQPGLASHRCPGVRQRFSGGFLRRSLHLHRSALTG